MGFTVTESIAQRQLNDARVQREYLVEWDGVIGEGETKDENTNEALAYAAVVTYLGTQTYDSKKLLYSLFGKPANTLDVTEVEDSDGLYYRAVAVWGRDNSGAGAVAGASSLSGSASGSDPDADTTISYGFQGRPPSREIDYAPTLSVFSRGIGKYTANAWVSSTAYSVGDVVLTSGKIYECIKDHTAGSSFHYSFWDFIGPSATAIGESPKFAKDQLNVVQKGFDKKLEVEGLRTNVPPVTLRAEIELTGAAASVTFVSNLKQAADRGVLNTAAFTVGGITFAPYTLLFCDFNVQASPGGKTSISVGFAVGRQLTIALTTASRFDDTGAAVDVVEGDLSEFLREDPQMALNYHHTTAPATPETPATLTYSSFDYVWSFIANEFDQETKAHARSWVGHVSIHRIWGEADFAGSSMFNTSPVTSI